MRALIALAAVALAAAACQSSQQVETERSAALEAEIAARQGAEIDRVCFTRNINGWRPLGRRAVLVRQSVRDWYMLDLVGSCEPAWAFNTIALRSRPAGGSCLTRGDTLITDDVAVPGRCMIDAIYEWDEGAPVEAPEEGVAAEGEVTGGPGAG
jgi:hypothetical protein